MTERMHRVPAKGELWDQWQDAAARVRCDCGQMVSVLIDCGALGWLCNDCFEAAYASLRRIQRVT